MKPAKIYATVYVFLIFSITLLTFQNCAPHNFETIPESSDLSSTSTPDEGSPDATCDPFKKPAGSESLQCPSGSTGSGPTRIRNVACDGTTWVTGPWGNLNFQNCKCTNPSQSINPVTGQCECPAGQTLIGSQCSVPTCNPAMKPSTLEIGSCPSGLGSSRRSRTVTCNMSTTQWTSTAWSAWDYSLCSCPAAGQTANLSTGVCACPPNQTVINGACKVPTCDPASKPATSESFACPSGSGTATRTRNVTCPSGGTQWSMTAWTVDYSKCTCPATGQILNAATGTCSCPAGQTVVAGKCQIPTCDPSTKPAESETLSCPSGSGSAVRTRTVSCPGGSTTWSAGAWTSNYLQCACPVPGQIPNASTGICACPAGQIVLNNSCLIPDCDSSSMLPTTQSGLICPNNSVGTFSQSRTAVCNKTTYQYEYSLWTINDSTCSCSVTGQTYNSATKTCVCPSGQVVNGTRCELPPQCPLPAPSSIEYQSCPSGSGTASRPRTVTCAAGATTWTIQNGSWNYSNCSCPVIGAALNSSTGTCSCPAGTLEIGGRCGTCAADEIYNSSTKSCAKITCTLPDTGVKVSIGSVYTVYTQMIGGNQAACDQSRVTLTCQSSGQWSGPIPSVRYATCFAQVKSTGQHCDIGGKWGWRSWDFTCPTGLKPISADKVGGCLDGASSYNHNGRIGCYYSNRDSRRPRECASSDPADECCYWQCSPQGEDSNWQCQDVYNSGGESGDSSYAYTWCFDQFGRQKSEYNPPPPPPPPPPCNWWNGCWEGGG